MSGDIFEKCPLCGTENYVSLSGEKIISCTSCGAPVYNTQRPDNTGDLKKYQTALSVWGEEHKESLQEKIKARVASVQQRNRKDREDRLQKQLSKLEADIEHWKGKYNSIKQGERAWEQEKENLKASHAQQIRDLQASNLAEKESYKSLQKKTKKIQAEITTLREILSERIQQESSYGEKILKDFSEFIKKKKTSEQSILTQLDKLLSKTNADELEDTAWEASTTEEIGDARAGNEQTDGVQTNDVQVKEKKEATQGQGVLGADVIAPSPQNTTDAHTQKSALTDSQSAQQQVEDASDFSKWLPYYNSIERASDKARQFSEQTSATALTVVKSHLEQQRSKLDAEQPIFEKGSRGSCSYWLLPSEAGHYGFLVLNKEHFTFNSANYQSITVCYDFNHFTPETLKDFKLNNYVLSDYQIIYPARVIYLPDTSQWQLHSRGRLNFAGKAIAQ